MGAPRPDPRLFAGMSGDPEVYGDRWIAAQTMNGEYVIALAGTVGADARGAAVIAQCPQFEIADYIAHAHNSLLATDPEAVKAILDHLAEDYAKGEMAPTHEVVKLQYRPEETGGYL